jgi:predicted acetyltransferase
MELHNLDFVLAEKIDKASYSAYINEWKNYNEIIIPWSTDIEQLSFEEWISKTISFRSKETCPSEYVVADTYFLTSNKKYIIGAVNIKYDLNEYLEKYGGNIGYGIRKSERGKGYAKKLLQFGLGVLRKQKKKYAQISCKKSNVASSKTIISCGGVLVRNELLNNEIKEIYSIELFP